MPQNTSRGFDPKDKRAFSDTALPLLRRAQQDIVMLLDRGYDLEQSVTFVGNRFQFSARQRTALTRATASTLAVGERTSRRLSDLHGGPAYIDGFNLIITLEAAQSPQTTLLRCNDGAVRDLCGLRGTYRLIESTAVALAWTMEALVRLGAPGAVFYLDAPVSNSGRLRTAVLENMKWHGLPGEVLLVPNADAELWGRTRVITSDAIILGRCVSWYSLAEEIITRELPARRLVELTEQSPLAASTTP